MQDTVQLLFNSGAAPDDALLEAAYRGHTDIVLFLLSKGVDPDRALPYAAKGGHVEIVKILLEQPTINVNAKDDYGRTALDRAVSNRHDECAELIRAAGGR